MQREPALCISYDAFTKKWTNDKVSGYLLFVLNYATGCAWVCCHADVLTRCLDGDVGRTKRSSSPCYAYAVRA